MLIPIQCASFLLMILAVTANGAGPEEPAEEVLGYLNRTIEWYRAVDTFNESVASSEETLLRSALHQDSTQVLRLAFLFGRGEAAVLAAEKTPASGGEGADAIRARNLAAAAASASQRVTQIQAELDQVNHRIGSAPTTAPATLTARRDKLIAELNLARVRQDVLQNFIGFNSGNGSSAGLSQKIDDLERSTPEAQAAQSSTAAKPGAAATPAPEPIRPEAAGIISLLMDTFTLSQRSSELRALAERTAALQKACDERRAPLSTALHDAIHRGDVLSQTKDSDEPAVLNMQRQEIDALAVRYKLLTAAVVPLGEQKILLDAVQTNLEHWHGAADRAYRRIIRALLVRLGAVVLSISFVLLISSLWRRATFRYVNDIRRRRQFLLIRRLLVSAIIVVIIVAGVVTEFGSLATFAGLITAGIAVALQTLILSGVAHFFFIGRYGVRVGDRVTISGITGDVIDVGVFRLYLMELGGDGRGLNPTGRIAVFSNSVLFQPAAFFKQIPGADYDWHEIALTLAPDTNHELAETKLMAAIESVVAGYRDTIQKQYDILKNSAHFPIPAPEPHGRLRFVDAGLEYVVRYPVETSRSVDIDDQITRKVLDTIEKEPSLRLVATGTPKIQTAGTPTAPLR